MLAAQLRSQFFLFFCFAIYCDVTMQKPVQLLATVKMSAGFWKASVLFFALASKMVVQH